MNLIETDYAVIQWLRKVSVPITRVALAIVFFWFGILKVVDLSPAGPMVEHLFYRTIPSLVSFIVFYKAFGIFECCIGIMFLIPRATRIVIPLLFLHMIAVFSPLVLLPGETWHGFLVPTLEGQYIIKNLVIIAAAIGVAANIDPWKHQSHRLS